MSLQRLQQTLSKPVDASSLVFLRVAFSSLILWDVWRYFVAGWIQSYYIQPTYHFKYYGFEWVHAWPGDGMFWHFGVLGLFALMMLVGVFYRLASVGLFVAFSYVFLLDQTRYLNHFYLVACVSFLLVLAPAARTFSVDAWLRRHSKLSKTIPYWAVLIFVVQFEIVYLYAGLVKITPDWLAGQPLTLWLARRDMIPVIGWWFTQANVALMASYGVIALHCLGAPLLLFKQTRFTVFVIYCVFHSLNALIFNIGIFPWLTIAGTLMFFDSDWPKHCWAKLSRRDASTPPLLSSEPFSASGKHQLLLVTLCFWFMLQFFFPLRHYLYPGLVHWTEEGHRFSWMMKLRDKQGAAIFEIKDNKSKQVWKVKPADFLESKQVKEVATRPDILLQFAHFIGRRWQAMGHDDVSVYGYTKVSLNGRPYQAIVDHERDLMKVKRTLWPPADWILPLTQPLPEESDNE